MRRASSNIVATGRWFNLYDRRSSILGADRGYVHGDFGENPTGDLQALPSSTLRAPPPVRRVRNDGSSDRSENAPGASLHVSRSTIATVQRAAHTALPSSSSIITCHTW